MGEQEWLAARSTLRSFPAGAVIAVPGQPSDDLIILLTGRIQVLIQVHRRHHLRPARRRGQVDRGDAEPGEHRGVARVHRGAGGVEHDVDVCEHRQAGQALDAFMRGGHAHAGSARQAAPR